jgi:hypothetical protein
MNTRKPLVNGFCCLLRAGGNASGEIRVARWAAARGHFGGTCITLAASSDAAGCLRAILD